jgi:hypothetical protein
MDKMVGMMAVAAIALLVLALVLTCVSVAFAFGPVASLSLASAFCVLGFLLLVCVIARIRDEHASTDARED